MKYSENQVKPNLSGGYIVQFPPDLLDIMFYG